MLLKTSQLDKLVKKTKRKAEKNLAKKEAQKAKEAPLQQESESFSEMKKRPFTD